MELRDRILVKTNQPGRPRKRVKVLAADKGYDAKDLRRALRKAPREKLPPEDFAFVSLATIHLGINRILLVR